MEPTEERERQEIRAGDVGELPPEIFDEPEVVPEQPAPPEPAPTPPAIKTTGKLPFEADTPNVDRIEQLQLDHLQAITRLSEVVKICNDPAIRGTSLGVRQIIQLLDRIKAIAQVGG